MRELLWMVEGVKLVHGGAEKTDQDEIIPYTPAALEKLQELQNAKG